MLISMNLQSSWMYSVKREFFLRKNKDYFQKAREMGFKLKIHADEIIPLQGAELAAEMNAMSAEHLLAASDKGIAGYGKGRGYSCNTSRNLLLSDAG